MSDPFPYAKQVQHDAVSTFNAERQQIDITGPDLDGAFHIPFEVVKTWASWIAEHEAKA